MRESTKKKVKYNAMLSVDSGAALGDCRSSLEQGIGAILFGPVRNVNRLDFSAPVLHLHSWDPF